MIDAIIAESPDEWSSFRDSDEKRHAKLQGFFVGKVMKVSKGQADGKAVTAILESRRNAPA
jgi:aspartyl-tRNA(Asn)/glutamyl-tRNA(Gln) amidotransferase subunit B